MNTSRRLQESPNSAFCKAANGAALTIILAILFTALALTVYAHPTYDDLLRAGRVRGRSAISWVIDEYGNHSGRWAGVGLMYLIASIVDISVNYGIFLFLIIVARILATYAFVVAVFDNVASISCRIGLVLGFFALYWTGLRSSGQTFYWLTGAIENNLSLSCGMFLIAALLLSASIASRRRRALATMTLCGIAAVVVSMHELYGIVLVLVLSAGTVVALVRRLPDRNNWLAVSLAAATGLLVVIAAPGNYVRAGGQARDMLFTISQTVMQMQQAFRDWVLNARVVLATIAFMLIMHAQPGEPKWLRTAQGGWKWFVLAVWLASLTICFAFPTWINSAKGSGLQDRTWDATYLLFLIGWFPIVLMFGRSLWEDAVRHKGLNKAISTCALAFAVSALAGPSLLIAVKDINSGAIVAYDRAMRARYEALREARLKGERNARVPELPTLPVSITFGDIDRKADERRNQAAALFFGFETIVLVDKDENKR